MFFYDWLSGLQTPTSMNVAAAHVPHFRKMSKAGNQWHEPDSSISLKYCPAGTTSFEESPAAVKFHSL